MRQPTRGRTRAPHPGALHRLGPPDHDDHRGRVGALAHARLRSCDPARALRIARTPRSQAPNPSRGPGSPKDAEVSPSARKQARPGRTTTPVGLETPVLAPGTAPICPRACPRGLRGGPQALHATLDPGGFMNVPG